MYGKVFRSFVNEDLHRLTKRFISVCNSWERVKKFPKELLVGDTSSLDERVERRCAIMWDIIAEKFLNYSHFKSSYCNFKELIDDCMESLDKNAGKENKEFEVLMENVKKSYRLKKSEDEEIGIIIEETSSDVFDERYVLFYLKKMYDSLSDYSKIYVDQNFVRGMFKGIKEVINAS